MSHLKVGIVGATGAVGLELMRLLDQRKFPLCDLRLFASNRSLGKMLPFQGSLLPVAPLEETSFNDLDLVFFAAGSALSKEYAPLAQKRGCLVIDNSSYFRKDPRIPLVIPEINPHALKSHEGLIANPNCATILMLMALFPLHRLFRLKRVVASTYQAASGAGLQAMEDLVQETKAHLEGRSYTRTKIPYPYAFNLFLHNSPLADNGYVEEELKMLHETRKILEDSSIQVTATCVRVPVLRSHSASLNAEFHDTPCPERARECLNKAKGVRFLENATPLEATGEEDILCGRLRKDLSHPHSLDLFVVGDQLLKGAALNAIQIAEFLGKGA